MEMKGSAKQQRRSRQALRVYHFVGSEHGLDDLRKRRLKIATITDLNDPFELLPASPEQTTRARFQNWRRQFDTVFGMLCFSRHWRNPVQWSHYAAKHTGLSLGFDIPAKILTRVRYTRNRLNPDVEMIERGGLDAQKEMLKVLATKYEHWRYESEVRFFTKLNDKDQDTGLYFAEFSSKLKLKEVIVGPLSSVSRDELKMALGDLASTVELCKARLAFRTYTITRQRNAALWK